MKWGTQYPESHDLSSLRLLGTVGEAVNPEAWRWMRSQLGRDTLDADGAPGLAVRTAADADVPASAVPAAVPDGAPVSERALAYLLARASGGPLAERYGAEAADPVVDLLAEKGLV